LPDSESLLKARRTWHTVLRSKYDLFNKTLDVRVMDCFFSSGCRKFFFALFAALLLAPETRAQETLIPAGSTWRWRKGTSEASNPASAWRGNGFDDTTWLTGPAPFHYGTNSIGGDDNVLTGTVLSDMLGNYRGVFLRRSFIVTNVAEVESVRFTVNYDDGFVAWINGTEVIRANVTASQPTITTVASASHEAGVAAALTPVNPPQSYLVSGANTLAVQAFNQNLATSTDFRFETTLQLIKRAPADTTPPGIASVNPAPAAKVGDLTRITVNFSEPVFGVDADDLQINNQPAGAVSGGAGSSSFTFTFTQPAPGLAAVSWSENYGITDSAGNLFDPLAPGAAWTYTLDDTSPPQVSQLVPVPSAQVSRLTQIEVMFDEPVFGVAGSHLLINGQPSTNVVGSGAGPYVFQFPQPVAGAIQVAWAANPGINDAATPPNAFAGGNWNVTLNPDVSSANITISEFVAASLNGLSDENSEVQDWIEIHNRGTAAVNLLGWSLTDDRNTPGKWSFPSRVLNSGEFLVVFASGKDRRAPTGANRFHTNFKLNAFGDYLALFNAESPRVPITEFTPEFPEQRNNHSYGLNSANTWHYFERPTPGGPNGDASIAGLAPPPHFSVERGVFDTPFNLILTATLEGATIRYTTDGNEPTATTGLSYGGPLQISNTTTLRAATFKSGYLPSRIRTHSYFFLDQVIAQSSNPPGFPNNWGTMTGSTFSPGSTIPGLIPADYQMDLDPVRVDPNNPASPIDPIKMQRLKEGLRELPIVSIVMKTDDMFGAGGLYPSSRESGVKPSNEKACSIEMVLPNGGAAFSATCGIDLHGNASRNPLKNPKHGFKLAFKGDFGESSLKYRLFADSPAEEFDDLILRPDFNSSWRHWSDSTGNGNGAFQRTRATRTRDAWEKETFRDMGNVASHNRFFHLFINGLYWGTYDFTEQPTDSFAVNYFGGAKSDFDVFDQGALITGTATAYNTMLGISNLANNSNYELMKQYLDVPEFIDYMLLRFFVGHQDWGNNKNWYALRKRVSGPAGTFKYFPWDGECLLLNEEVNRVSNTDVPSGLHTKLDDNAEYRLDFADRVFKQLIAPGGALTPSANIARWKKWLAVLDKPIVAESARWGDYRRDVHRYSEGAFVLYTRETQWLAESNRLVNSYFVNRNNVVLDQLRTAGLFPRVDTPLFSQQGGRVAPGFNLGISAPAGTIHYTTNGVDPRVYGSGAVSPQATAYTGTPLALASSVVIKARVLSAGNWSALNEAAFAVGQLAVPLRITEIMYNPPGGDAYEFVEIMNSGTTPLDVSGFSFQGANYIFPDNSLIQPGATLLLSSTADTNAFRARYPSTLVFGTFGGSLNNAGERLAILDRNGQTVTALHYDDENGWPSAADGAGASLEIIDTRGDPNAPDNWRSSSLANGTPGLPPTAPPLGNVVLNEVMADNLSAVAHAGAFPDWIELHNRGTAPVSLGNWSLTDDGDARKFVFPADAMLGADGYLVIWCDSATNAPGLHAGFALGRNGDSVFLYDTNTNRVDAISFGLQPANYALGRVNDGWQLTVPTPNAINVPAVLGSPTSVAINEWLANPLPGAEDWIELYNRSASAPVSLRGLYLGTANAIFQIRSLSFLPPGGYVQLFADEQPGAAHLEFRLPAAGSTITLTTEAGVEFDRISYAAQTAGISEGKLPDGGAAVATFPQTVSPGASNYLLSYAGPVINELLVRNQRANLSPWGTYVDWIEIYNPADSASGLGNLALGDSVSGGNRWTFPAGTSIPANGYIVIWCDDLRAASTNNEPALNTGFSLNRESGDVYLFNTSGQAVDWVNYGFQLQDQSIGRTGGSWGLLASPTPGANNSPAALLGPATNLRINEWMAGSPAGDDWFELYNTAALPVNMAGLFLTDNPSSSGVTNAQVAPLSFIGGNNWVKWVADGRLSAGRNHVNFSLDDLGETLRLYDTNSGLIDAVDFGLQVDGVSQGRLPDGTAAIVNFPGTATPGASNSLVVAAPSLSGPQLLADGRFSCFLSGPTNQTYVIEYSTNLVDWSEASVLQHTGALTRFVDPENVAVLGQRFYRARLSR
jgi:hypothetical protein